MRWMQQTVLAVGLLCIVQEPAYAAKATFLFDKFGSEEFECWHSQVAGSFTANSAKYSISGSCILNIQKLKIPWTAQGSYDARTANGQVDEKIVVNGQSPFRGEFRLKMVCNTRRTGASFDPWLWLGDDKCTQIQIEATGGMAGTITINNTATDFVKLILNRAQGQAAQSQHRSRMTASRSSQNVSMTYGPRPRHSRQKSAGLNSSSKEQRYLQDRQGRIPRSFTRLFWNRKPDKSSRLSARFRSSWGRQRDGMLLGIRSSSNEEIPTEPG